MPEREFEIYLSVLSRLLRLTSKQKDAIADELRDHLEERLTDLMQSGLSREDAIKQALDDFGDVSGLALDFTNVSRTPFRRLVMRTTLATAVVTGIAMLGLFLFAPEPERGTQFVSVVHAQQEKPDVPKKAIVANAEPKSVFLQDHELFPDFLTDESGCNFSDTPLEDALQFFATLHEIQILMDRQALHDAGVAVDAPITITIGSEDYKQAKFTFEEVLNLVCRPLSLGWRVDGDIVIITTIDGLREHLLTRHYDLSPLQRVGYSVARLREAILLEGHGWVEDGTGNGTTTTYGDTISIRASHDSHRRIARLLAALEKPERVTHLSFSSNRKEIHEALAKRVDCNFADTPLSDAVQFFTTTSQIPFQIDATGLKDAGIDVDVPVTLTLTRKPLEQVLRLMLKEKHLTTEVRNGMLMVRTLDDANQDLSSVVYDVGRLVAVDSKDCGKNGATRCAADEGKLEDLQNLIYELHPDGWEVEGSGNGKLVSLETGVLVIQQTDLVHGELQSLFARLHAAAEKAQKVPTATPPEPKLITRSYLISKDAATDLSTSLRELVAVPSWKLAINGEVPSVHVVAAEPRLQEVSGTVVGGPFEVRMPEPKAPPKPEPGKAAPNADPVKSIIVRPQANVVIRQTPENHRAIERFIRNVTGDSSVRGIDPNQQNGGGFGGGFF